MSYFIFYDTLLTVVVKDLLLRCQAVDSSPQSSESYLRQYGESKLKIVTRVFALALPPLEWSISKCYTTDSPNINKNGGNKDKKIIKK